MFFLPSIIVYVVACYSEIARERFEPATCFDEVVWPAYLRCHDELQHAGNVGKPADCLHLAINHFIIECITLQQWWAVVNPSTGSSVLLHQREVGVILTPLILWCILLVLSGVLNANQLISPRRNASSIILLHLRGGIAIRHVCLFVRLCVCKHVLGQNILKLVGDCCSVTMEHL